VAQWFLNNLTPAQVGARFTRRFVIVYDFGEAPHKPVE
jgi:hypothetical protein